MGSKQSIPRIVEILQSDQKHQGSTIQLHQTVYIQLVLHTTAYNS